MFSFIRNILAKRKMAQRGMLNTSRKVNRKENYQIFRGSGARQNRLYYNRKAVPQWNGYASARTSSKSC